MDSLAGYTSDEDNASSSAVSPPSFVSYLENYMAQQKLATAFVSLPWKPAPPTIKKINLLGSSALAAVNKTVPTFTRRFRPNHMTSIKPATVGTFNLTSKYAFDKLHVLVFPNFHGAPPRLEQFASNMRRVVASVRPAPLLVKERPVSKLDAMLSTSPKPKEYLLLGLKPQLRLSYLNRTRTVFVSLDLEDLPLPTHDYLYSLTREVENQAELLGFEYLWFHLVGKENATRDLLRYHCTILLCEVKMPDYALKSDEVARLRAAVAAVDVRLTLRDMELDVDTVEIKTTGGMNVRLPLVT